VAYLLCRIADTIEDTVSLSPAEKRRLLARFAECLAEANPNVRDLQGAFASPATADEMLVREADRVLAEFGRLPEEQRAAIRPWVQEMCAGMASFVEGSVSSVDDLDRYCYFVAGTVGHLLTGLFVLHHGETSGERRQRLESLATSFGLGLQLTNIIKDIADDRERGRIYVPEQLSRQVGLDPGQIQDSRHRDQSRLVMGLLIDKASRHLRDALDYCIALPRSEYRIRLFCLTSLYFAVRTLHRARHDPRLLDPTHKVKITRAEVYRTVLVTHVVAPMNSLVRAYFRHLAGGMAVPAR